MKQPHKHADMIKAWADGAEIEFRTHDTIEWKPILKSWSWDSIVATYRIKPEPQTDYQLVRSVHLGHVPSLPAHPYGILTIGQLPYSNVMFTFDGETHELKKVELI